MVQNHTPAQYKAAFIKRLKAIRVAGGYTQEKFAMIMGLSRDTYAKYESRSLLPHHLIPQVAKITGKDLLFILTGKSGDEPTDSSSE